MPEQVPLYFELFFIAITAAAGWFFLQANKYFKVVSLAMICWLIIQTVLAEKGFYTRSSGMPPRLTAAVLPPVIFIIACFLVPAGRRYLDTLDARMLTWLHIVRIPVEFCLYTLMIHHLVPEIMTFEGRNFDIISGITAPFIAYFGYTKKRLSKTDYRKSPVTSRGHPDMLNGTRAFNFRDRKRCLRFNADTRAYFPFLSKVTGRILPGSFCCHSTFPFFTVEILRTDGSCFCV